MKKLIALGLCLALLTACSHQRFQIDETASERTIPSYEGTSHFFFWGLAQTKKYNPAEICGKGNIESVEAHDSFLDGLLGALTWGIYAPRTYTIYCKTNK